MKPIAGESYRDQLRRLTQGLARADTSAVRADLSPDSTLNAVKMFVDGNLDKRFEKLQDALELVGGAFRDFDELIADYVRAIPLSAYDTGASDCERMLRWLRETRRLTPRQRDHIACEEARHQVEALARSERLAYVRFQERRSVTPQLAEQLLEEDGPCIYLNPIRVWTVLETNALVGDDAQPPCHVVFFPVDGEIHSALLEAEGRQWIEELTERAPITLAAWGVTSAYASADELVDVVRDLAEMGLVALG